LLRKALVVADFEVNGVVGVALGWWRIFILGTQILEM
jgi:hypothetical protein